MFLFRLEREHNTFLYNANTVEHVLTVLLDRVYTSPNRIYACTNQ